MSQQSEERMPDLPTLPDDLNTVNPNELILFYMQLAPSLAEYLLEDRVAEAKAGAVLWKRIGAWIGARLEAEQAACDCPKCTERRAKSGEASATEQANALIGAMSSKAAATIKRAPDGSPMH